MAPAFVVFLAFAAMAEASLETTMLATDGNCVKGTSVLQHSAVGRKQMNGNLEELEEEVAAEEEGEEDAERLEMEIEEGEKVAKRLEMEIEEGEERAAAELQAEVEEAAARARAEETAEIAVQVRELALSGTPATGKFDYQMPLPMQSGTAGAQACLPAMASHTDVGYSDLYRGWYDVQGCGRCHDYCRWVGVSGSGGDPVERREFRQSGRGWSWWSCRLAGASNAYTPRGHFASWDFVKCSGLGAPTPPPANPYVPGQPGASWSVQEMLDVRAKLHRVFTEGDWVFMELGIPLPANFHTSIPNAAKALRLGFHDCLRYVNGTGGCDGCLEWQGMGVSHPLESLGRGLFPANAADDGHNNGLGVMVDVLEGVYTDGGFPSRTPVMARSLQETGKSRADLWAFAALVAVDYSISLNNAACDDPDTYKQWPWGQCHPRDGEADCKVAAPRPFSFKTGRRDCGGSFRTDSVERHPDPSTNGQGTVDFFKRDFGFTGRETVAIMGAHTLGRFSVFHSLFRYTWKSRSGKLFNNGYFRNLALRRDWYQPSDADDGKCVKVGDRDGGRPEARWMPHVRGDTTTGGPVQWLQEKKVCKIWDTSLEAPQVCSHLPKRGTLEWKFVVGVDETAMPCEIGLYFDFQVDGQGIPSGCRGFERFNLQEWGRTPDGHLANGFTTWTLINNKRKPPRCPFTMIREPSSEEPTHKIVEEYADDNAAFFRDFFPTLEKMLANGYDATTELEEAPVAGMSGFSCPLRTSGQYACVSSTGSP